jgi:hypothetical protein
MRFFRDKHRFIGMETMLFAASLAFLQPTSAQEQDDHKRRYDLGWLNPGWYKCQITCTRLDDRAARILAPVGDLAAVFGVGEQVGQFVIQKPMKLVCQVRANADIEIGKPVRMPVMAEPGEYTSRKWDLPAMKIFTDYAMVRMRAGSEREDTGQIKKIREAGLIPAYRFWVHPAYDRWPMKLRNGDRYDGTKFRPWLDQGWEAFSTWVLERTAPQDFVILDFEAYGEDKWANFANQDAAKVQACKVAVTQWMPTDRKYVVLPHSWTAEYPRATSEALAAAGAKVWFRGVSERPPPNASAMWFIKQSWHKGEPPGCGFSAHWWIQPDNAAVWAENWINYAAVGGVPMVWCEDPAAWTIAANALKQNQK